MGQYINKNIIHSYVVLLFLYCVAQPPTKVESFVLVPEAHCLLSHIQWGKFVNTNHSTWFSTHHKNVCVARKRNVVAKCCKMLNLGEVTQAFVTLLFHLSVSLNIFKIESWYKKVTEPVITLWLWKEPRGGPCYLSF